MWIASGAEAWEANHNVVYVVKQATQTVTELATRQAKPLTQVRT
jgi:hypothetical protein